MKKTILFSFFLYSSLSLVAQSKQQIQNLKAFIKTYGYIRYYHPSDESASIDWDKFTVYGIERILNCQNNKVLKDSLTSIFSPIVPVFRFSSSQNKIQIPLKKLLPKDTIGLKPIFWQHNSIGLGKEHLLEEYADLRANRPAIIIPPTKSNQGRFGATIQVKDYQRLPFRIAVKIKKVLGSGYVIVRYYNPANDGQILEKYYKPNEWQQIVIDDVVETNAEQMNIAICIHGGGEAWFDDLSFQIFKNGFWQSLYTNDFEQEKMNKVQDDEYLLKTKIENGNSFLSITSLPKPLPYTINKGELLPASFPKIGDVYEAKINDELYISFPLVLLGNEKQTFPIVDKQKINNLQKQLKFFPEPFEMDIQNLNVRLGNICIIWNLIQHFFPYFESAKVDWSQYLELGIKEAYTSNSSDDFYLSIHKILKPLKDAHNRVSNEYSKYRLPVWFDETEDKLYISKIWKGAEALVKVGDIVSSINNIETKKFIEQNRQFVLNSSESGFISSLSAFISEGKCGSTIDLLLNKGEESERTVTLTRSRRWVQETVTPKPVTQIKSGIYLIDCSLFDKNIFEKYLDTLKQAKGLIFDVRNYPRYVRFLNYFLKHPVEIKNNMLTQISMKPDQKDLEYNRFGWSFLEPSPFQFTAKAVFLTNGIALSRAETLMSIVKHYKIGTIIGSATSGTNGGMIETNLLADFYFSFTGTRYSNADGSTHHTVGVLPDIELKPTIKGIREGRDELVEKALEILKK